MIFDFISFVTIFLKRYCNRKKSLQLFCTIPVAMVTFIFMGTKQIYPPRRRLGKEDSRGLESLRPRQRLFSKTQKNNTEIMMVD